MHAASCGVLHFQRGRKKKKAVRLPWQQIRNQYSALRPPPHRPHHRLHSPTPFSPLLLLLATFQQIWSSDLRPAYLVGSGDKARNADHVQSHPPPHHSYPIPEQERDPDLYACTLENPLPFPVSSPCLPSNAAVYSLWNIHKTVRVHRLCWSAGHILVIYEMRTCPLITPPHAFIKYDGVSECYGRS